MDDIAGLRNLARVLHVSRGHRGDVHQPVLMDPDIDKGAECGDVGHDTFENHARLQILELFHSLTEVRGFVGWARITSWLLEFPQNVRDSGHPETASVNASGSSWRNTDVLPISPFSSLLVATRMRRTTG